ncbi:MULTISPECIES: hypothetical protein [unclassified Curtobacterium]|uniref:hypothetical protein n=1 Tax=unclassified Curtobacterium TaxID=257496 RepID=UPI0039AE9B63
MTNATLRRAAAVASAAALSIGLVGVSSPANASTTPGTNLRLSWTGTTDVYDKAPIKYTFTVTNKGRVAAKTSTLRWYYQLPVQPKAPTNGGYINLKATAGNKSHCSVDVKKHIATCQLGALASGASTQVTWTGSADSKGAGPRGLSGAYLMTVESSPAGIYGNDQNTGGWAISTPR